MIRASNVDVFIGRKQILHGVDFEAAPRAFTAIVGPNGSGKSTFLKALAGEIAHDGNISINGVPLQSLKPWQAAARRAVMAQQTTLSFPFTVREIVRLGLTGGFSGARPGEIEHLPERALEAVDLKGFAGRYYQDFPAASSSACSLRGFCARSGRRCSTASLAICFSTSRSPASTSSTRSRSCRSRATMPCAAAG
jgi:iron complex transport system ATP-binding protein